MESRSLTNMLLIILILMGGVFWLRVETGKVAVNALYNDELKGLVLPVAESIVSMPHNNARIFENVRAKIEDRQPKGFQFDRTDLYVERSAVP